MGSQRTRAAPQETCLSLPGRSRPTGHQRARRGCRTSPGRPALHHRVEAPDLDAVVDDAHLSPTGKMGRRRPRVGDHPRRRGAERGLERRIRGQRPAPCGLDSESQKSRMCQTKGHPAARAGGRGVEGPPARCWPPSPMPPSPRPGRAQAPQTPARQGGRKRLRGKKRAQASGQGAQGELHPGQRPEGGPSGRPSRNSCPPSGTRGPELQAPQRGFRRAPKGLAPRRKEATQGLGGLPRPPGQKGAQVGLWDHETEKAKGETGGALTQWFPLPKVRGHQGTSRGVEGFTRNFHGTGGEGFFPPLHEGARIPPELHRKGTRGFLLPPGGISRRGNKHAGVSPTFGFFFTAAKKRCFPRRHRRGEQPSSRGRKEYKIPKNGGGGGNTNILIPPGVFLDTTILLLPPTSRRLQQRGVCFS